jgi:hypothetical protein
MNFDQRIFLRHPRQDVWQQSVFCRLNRTQPQFSRGCIVGCDRGRKDLVLDADDLAIGYRLDVGFCTAATSPLQWACLTNREVKYSLPKNKNFDLNKAIDVALGLSSAAARTTRAELDGSVLAMPTRLLQNADGNKTGFAESVLAAWQGDPLGIHAHEQRLGVCPGEGLELNLDFNLLSAPRHCPYLAFLSKCHDVNGRVVIGLPMHIVVRWVQLCTIR